ncbi:MAG: transcriptional repressor LexA [Candidatus Eiseniibacteriota bacterium]
MLNDRAREILNFIKNFTRERGYPPTIREIGLEFRIRSTNGVRYYLTMLEKSGLLRRNGRISRGIGAVLPPAPAAGRHGYSIPVLGRVAAGQPMVAEESYEGSIEPLELFGEADGMFALRVRGDSMIDAGILEDDYVIVRRQDHALAGEIVVALLEDEATVKYYRPRRGSVELVAANSKYQPIVVSPDAGLRILGVVRGVIRTVGR